MSMCLFPCYMVRSLSSHVCMHVLCSYAYVYAFTCLYAWICVLPCVYVCIFLLGCISTCLLCISMLICVDRCVYMLRLMFSTCFMSSSMCLGASRHVYVLSLDLVCHAMCYCSHFVPFIAFFFCVFGLMVRTRSGPYGICHRPYTKAHIKGFGSPLFACLCLLASILYACVNLSCSRLCHA